MSQTQSSRGRGAPAASTATRGVILVVGAVIIGAMLLWKGGGAEKATVTGEDILKPVTSPGTKGTTTTTQAPSTTAVAPAQLLVVFANGSGTTGLAKTKAEQLKAKGYSATTYVAGTVTPLTMVFYVAGFEADAQAVAIAMGLPAARVAPIADPAPVAKLGDNKVVVVIGQDKGDPNAAGAPAPTTPKKPAPTTAKKPAPTTTKKP